MRGFPGLGSLTDHVERLLWWFPAFKAPATPRWWNSPTMSVWWLSMNTMKGIDSIPIESVANEPLARIADWIDGYGLKLAYAKTETALLTRKWAFRPLVIVFGGHVLPIVRPSSISGSYWTQSWRHLRQFDCPSSPQRRRWATLYLMSGAHRPPRDSSWRMSSCLDYCMWHPFGFLRPPSTASTTILSPYGADTERLVGTYTGLTSLRCWSVSTVAFLWKMWSTWFSYAHIGTTCGMALQNNWAVLSPWKILRDSSTGGEKFNPLLLLPDENFSIWLWTSWSLIKLKRGSGSVYPEGAERRKNAKAATASWRPPTNNYR